MKCRQRNLLSPPHRREYEDSKQTLKRCHQLPKDWQLTQGLFGEHLLPQHPDIDAYHDWLMEFLQDNK